MTEPLSARDMRMRTFLQVNGMIQSVSGPRAVVTAEGLAETPGGPDMSESSRAFSADVFPERFRQKVEWQGDCLEWTSIINNMGYGSYWDSTRRKKVLAHRYAYEFVIGPIPDGLTVDHLCRNTKCVNPQHLEAVTQAENLLRGNGWSGRNARKTHCVRGHKLPEIRSKRGFRECQLCLKEHWRKRNIREREARQ